MGLAPIHSSIAISSMPGCPKGLMHQPIPDRSINWPISSSSGTRVASWSRERVANLLVMDFSTGVNLDRDVDIRFLVLTLARVCRLLAILDHLGDRSVELGAEREAEVVGQEDRHF